MSSAQPDWMKDPKQEALWNAFDNAFDDHTDGENSEDFPRLEQEYIGVLNAVRDRLKSGRPDLDIEFRLGKET